MIWPAAALAALVLAFVVAYASVLQSRLAPGSGGAVAEVPDDTGLEPQMKSTVTTDVASAGGAF